MKGSEQNAVIQLGMLQGINEAMGRIYLNDRVLMKQFMESKSKLIEVMNAHRETCDKLVTEDDT